MSKESSFDIVSQIDLSEVGNAVHQVSKEIEQRFDLKGTHSGASVEKEAIVIHAPDDLKLRNVVDILLAKLVKRSVPTKNLEFGKVEPALGGAVKQTITLKQGIDKDMAKKILGIIKDKKLKVQAQIQDDQIRVVGKSKDDLQEVIAALKTADLPLDLQYLNYR